MSNIKSRASAVAVHTHTDNLLINKKRGELR